MLHACCALCSQPAAAAVNLGPLLGPIRDAKNPAADEVYVHRLCALWSSEVFETDHGTLRNVLAAIKRGRQMKCSQCGRRGATLGCRVPSCNCSYHVACAKEAGCTYYCEQFQVSCPAHAQQFRTEARQQNRRTPFTPHRHGGGATGGAGRAAAELAGAAVGMGGGAGFGALEQQTPGGGAEGDGAELPSPVELPTFVGRKRGRRQEAMMQHMAQAQAAMKRARRELERNRRKEPESSDDDEHFQKKETRRLARDVAKLNPITLMGDGTAVQHVFVKSPAPGQAKRDGVAEGQALPGGGGPRGRQPQPLQQQQPTVETAVVGSIATTDFTSVAGLDDVVRQLREMVLLPMQYPALFEGMGLRPPRGILFHGEPGTGKTLVARALAGACAKHSPTPVTFFARKGADCLGKFHGEAERTLRLLFEEASRRAPAIIFLDELDALVPARAARAGGGDQIYASVVSTLLSLMDGVTDRGSVIVIGATNRPEAIDPALRRPGRFDREVYFGLPTPAQRLAILRVHTQRWRHPPPDDLLQQVAARAEGYAGADLQALCTAAVMAAVRRSAPRLLEQAEREAAGTAAVAAVAVVGAGGVGGDAGAGDGGRAAAADAAAAAVVAPLEQLHGQEQRGHAGQHQKGEQPGKEKGQTEGEHQERPRQQQQQQQEQRERLLDGIRVHAGDWREALAAAPPPCSRRGGLSALAAEAAAPLQQQGLALVADPLKRVLATLHAADLPLPPPAAAAARVAGGSRASWGALGGSSDEQQQRQQQQRQAELEAVLLKEGALLPPPGLGAAASAAASGPAAAAPGTRASSLAARRAARLGGEEQEDQWQRVGRSYAPCRLLLRGEGEQGHEAVAGAVLKLLDGCPVHCLSLPSLVAEGGDDAAAGCVALVGEALRRANPHTPCVFYLPRLESWALSETRMRSEELTEAGWFCRMGRARSPARVGSDSIEEEEEDADMVQGAGRQPPSARRGSGMQSPSFAGRASSPVGASPGHRGFPLAPSPFSGLLPLEERVGHTPAVAHALRSVTQLHRQQQQQHHLQQEEEEEDGPTLGELQRRASFSEPPGTAGRPPRPPAPAPAAAVLAPPAGLPPIRTSASPEQPRQPQQQRGQGQAALALAAAAAAGVASGSDGAGRKNMASAAGSSHAAQAGAREKEVEREKDDVEEEEEEEEGAEVEVVCLSQAWNVFEALMRQVPATQPIIVLATCHTAAGATPANLAQFFAGPAAAAAAAAAADGGPRTGAGAGAASLEGPGGAATVAAPGIVRMAQPSAAAWQRAAAAAAEHVAAAVAAQTALLWHQQLSRATAAAAEGAEPAGGGTPPQQAEQAVPAEPAVLTPSRRRVQRAQQEPEQQCNTAELEQGLRLFDRLLSFQQQMGAALARERVAALHRWAVRPAVAGSGGSRRRSGPSCPPTFAQITQRCQQGCYDSTDALQADAAAAAAHVLALAEEAQQRQQEQQQRRRVRQQEAASPDRSQDAQAAVTAACTVQDKVDTACFALRQELHLSDPSNTHLLAAAAAHVRRLQRQQQEREAAERREREAAEEEAERRRREAEEEEERERLQAEEGRQEEQQKQPGGAADQRKEVDGAAEQEGDEEMVQQVGDEGAADDQQELRSQLEAERETMQVEQADAEAAAARREKELQPAAQQQRQQPVGTPAAEGAKAGAADPAAAETELPQQQQQQQQQEQRQRIALACQQLRSRLGELLLPAVRERLPAVPAEGEEATAWQALQEHARRLCAAAAAACRGVLSPGLAAAAGGVEDVGIILCNSSLTGAGARQLGADELAPAAELAARCVAAFQAAEPLPGLVA